MLPEQLTEGRLGTAARPWKFAAKHVPGRCLTARTLYGATDLKAHLFRSVLSYRHQGTLTLHSTYSDPLCVDAKCNV